MSSKLEVIDENTFRMTLETGKLRKLFGEESESASMVFTHKNIEWSFGIQSYHNSKLQFFIRCDRENSNNYRVDLGNLQTKLSHNGVVFKEVTFRKSFFNSEVNTRGNFFYTPNEEIHDELWADEIKMETTVNIVGIFGNYEERLCDFTEKDEEMNTVTLMVEDKELFVNKDVLCCFSPVFKKMLSANDFEEVLVISDTNYKSFVKFLQLLHHCSAKIGAHNVKALLQLAKVYEVPFVTEKCEKFLLDSTHVLPGDKESYADEFNLQDVKKKCQKPIETEKVKNKPKETVAARFFSFLLKRFVIDS